MPFQDDIAAALQQARQHAYDHGDFYRYPPSERALSMTEEEYVAWGIAQTKADLPDDVEWEPSGEMYRDEWREAHVVVTGPDSLIQAQSYGGTHSVIDMTHVAEEPDNGAVAPASSEHLRRIFGTTEPTPDMIETAIDDGRLAGFARWCAKYLIAYRDGAPVEIFFVGDSGD